jgi:hypothetical protein
MLTLVISVVLGIVMTMGIAAVAFEMTVEPVTAEMVTPKPSPMGMLRALGSVTTMGVATVAETMFTVSVTCTMGADVYPLPSFVTVKPVIFPMPVEMELSTVAVPVAWVPPIGGAEIVTPARPASYA